jgi:hypothetical protein
MLLWSARSCSWLCLVEAKRPGRAAPLRGVSYGLLHPLKRGKASGASYLSLSDGAKLTGDNRSILYILRAFGPGFITLTDKVEASYHHRAFYSPEADGGCERSRRRNSLATGDVRKDCRWPDLNSEFQAWN